MESTISKWGNSQGVRIPVSVLKALNLKINDSVDISSDEESGTIVIRKKVPKEQKLTLSEIFEGYTGEGSPEMDWGEPVGKEVIE